MEYNFTFREKDKGFQVILSYKDNRGCWKQKSKQGFKTKREAKIAGDKLLEEVKANAPIYMDNSTARITFGEFSAMYLNDIRRSIAYIQHSTRIPARYQSLFRTNRYVSGRHNA